MLNPAVKNYPNIAQSFGIVGILFLGMLLATPIMFIPWLSENNEALLLVYYLLSIGLPLLLIYFIRKKKTKSVSFNLSIKNGKIIPFVVVATIILLIGIVPPIGNLIPVPESLKTVLAGMSTKTGIFTFILMVIVAPIMEEIIFRGIILDGLLNSYSPIKSILISSLLFGIVHLNPWQFVTAMIIGVFAGWLYYRTRSLSLAIIIHASANLCGFLMRTFIDFEKNMDKTYIESFGGISHFLMYVIGSIIFVVSCIVIIDKELNSQPPKLKLKQKKLSLHKQL